MSNTGVPYSCARCREDGSPTGQLVFLGGEIPRCRYHDELMIRSRYYDEQGNRIGPSEYIPQEETSK